MRKQAFVVDVPGSRNAYASGGAVARQSWSGPPVDFNGGLGVGADAACLAICDPGLFTYSQSLCQSQCCGQTAGCSAVEHWYATTGGIIGIAAAVVLGSIGVYYAARR